MKNGWKNGKNFFYSQGREKPIVYRPKFSAWVPAIFLPNLVEIGDSLPEKMGTEGGKTPQLNTDENCFTINFAASKGLVIFQPFSQFFCTPSMRTLTQNCVTIAPKLGAENQIIQFWGGGHFVSESRERIQFFSPISFNSNLEWRCLNFRFVLHPITQKNCFSTY